MNNLDKGKLFVIVESPFSAHDAMCFTDERKERQDALTGKNNEHNSPLFCEAICLILLRRFKGHNKFTCHFIMHANAGNVVKELWHLFTVLESKQKYFVFNFHTFCQRTGFACKGESRVQRPDQQGNKGKNTRRNIIPSGLLWGSRHFSWNSRDNVAVFPKSTSVFLSSKVTMLNSFIRKRAPSATGL